MTFTIKQDLSEGTLTREDGHFITVGPSNPVTLKPWESEAEIEDTLTSLASLPHAWVAPAEGSAEEPISVTPIQFKLLWTIEERLALKALRQSDPVVDDFWEILDDPRLDAFRLDLKSTQDGIAYCLSKLAERGTILEEDIPARLEQLSTATQV